MKQSKIFLGLLLTIMVLGSLIGSNLGTITAAATNQEPTLRQLAEQKGINIGAAVFSWGLTGDFDNGAYATTLAKEFNMLTAENEMKFDALQPIEGYFDFSNGDAIVDFAQKSKMKVRGHTLIWHEQLPAWVKNGTWDRQSLLAVMENHISTVVSHYRGKVAYWDVVNEAVSDQVPHKLRDTIWSQHIGQDYIDRAFHAAHKADPDAKLFYNDYGADDFNSKATAIYEMVKGMLERGVPIHGVGFQMHIDTTGIFYFSENMKRFTDLGLEVHITEMDVRIPTPGVKTTLANQAEVYYQIFSESLNNPKITSIVLWGFTDRHTWIPKYAPYGAGFGEPLIFDVNYNKKPAYYSIQEALQK
ncbi:MAG TPA: endo-1,4-beta-xylanase [Bacillota bacterium]|nr:endo-1,4-beta-xylanase [Bacillota bacterium]HOL10236.1 endo-1,4-beta-xylanase [Bacillota bacterium]HPO98004.1 endo-1,4-beta-xylanase [Bacillota bacterium]